MLGPALYLLTVPLAVGVAPPPLAPEVPAARLVDGKVLVEIGTRGLPEKERWPAGPVAASEHYTADVFGFSRLPHLYVDTGVRADRPNPFLVRAAARVEMPAGTHRLLLRGRGAARLWVDGRLVLRTPFPPPITDGHNAIPTNYLDLGPDFRFAPPGNRERWTSFASRGGRHLVVLETIVGGRVGKNERRPELGETVVAISFVGTTTFHLLSPGRKVPYTDTGWAAYAADEATRVATLEAERRAQLRRDHAAEWEAKRRRDRAWLAATPEPKVPPRHPGAPAFNAIEHFLAAALPVPGPAAAKGAVNYAREVKPLLEAKCFACHRGAKVRGGLRLDTLVAARAGGDSGKPALVPGKPEDSLLLTRIRSEDKNEIMPPKGERLTKAEVELLQRWIADGAPQDGPVRAARATPPADDLTFLRRVTLDTVGLVPTLAEIDAFLADPRPDRRRQRIDALLADPRSADHGVGPWLDLLAENPNILNPTLNNTGPFRWWVHESLLDHKPLDLFATELVRMRGSPRFGGPAGFGVASENDVPLAEKAAVVASAFLGVQMKCARCHDAPGHRSTQRDLFGLAALLAEGPVAVPATSSVPLDKVHQGGRKPLIAVTLPPGSKVAPAWPFAELLKPEAVAVTPGATPRDRLAALLTAGANERFAEVLANRTWRRLMGRGLMEPADDWEKGECSHPELLRYLGRELVRSGYDAKHLERLILNSHAYQRAVDPSLAEPDGSFAAPARRRLTAEQVVDAAFAAVGKPLATEEISLDIDGGREVRNSISLGVPRRAWHFASTSNERDRPSLALPRVQAVVDVLEAFGWRSARPAPLSERDQTPNVLQPAVLANGTVGSWLTRLSDDHGVTRLAVEATTVEGLVERLYLQVLTRRPRGDELATAVAHLREGFAGRHRTPPAAPVAERRPPRYVSWSNHLTPEANEIKLALEAAARRGDPPTLRLEPQWRERLEDVLWSLLNAPEFVFAP